MTTPLWCLLVVALLPYVLAGFGTWLRGRELGHIDNNTPREQWKSVRGPGIRIYSAQANAWEALGLFTAAVVVAHLAGAAPGASATASVLFVLSRIAHAVCYAMDAAVMRSVVFMVGFFSVLALFGLAIAAG